MALKKSKGGIMSKKQKTATVIKTWTFDDGSTREKRIYTGPLKLAKKKIPPKNSPRYPQFRIEFHDQTSA